MRNNKGITLIALVITIIVIVILAGVTLSVTIGENGVLTQAQTAKEVTEEAAKDEEKEFESVDMQMAEVQNKESWDSIINSDKNQNSEGTEGEEDEEDVLTLEEFQASFAGGTGTESDPYQITTPLHLAYLAKYTNEKVTFVTGSYFKMMNDIDLEYREWTAIGIGDSANPERTKAYCDKLSQTAFKGYFDGNGHKITRIYINQPNNCSVGVFGTLDGNAVIQNLTIESGRVIGKYHVGGIAGLSINGTVKNCINKAEIIAQDNATEASGENAGGIVGTMTTGTSLVENCINYGNATAKNDTKRTNSVGKGAGGIVGYVEHYSGAKGNYTIKNSINYGTIIGNYQQIGGITGYIDSGRIEGCINNGTVVCISHDNTKTTAGTYVGGISGVLSDGAIIDNCKNTGEIIADLGWVGGISGRILSGTKISNCENSGKIKQLNKFKFEDLVYSVGGICGRNEGTMQYCYNRGDFKNSNNIGGLIGQLESGTLTKNYYYVASITKGIGFSAEDPDGNDVVGQAEKIELSESQKISNFAAFKTWIETK